MKRTVPLIITAVVGFVFIVSFFTPAAEFLGELAAVWFDILAGIAFVLGGGNLLKMQLKKISDRKAGWGYSLVTVVAFLTMLTVGLFKFGSPPAANQEFYGECFAPLELADFPETQFTRIDGAIPTKANGKPLRPSVRRQLFQVGSQICFRGWMLPNQEKDLEAFKDLRSWKHTVSLLSDKAQPPDAVKGKVFYYADHAALGFKGTMTDPDHEILSAMSPSTAWKQAVERLYEQSRVTASVHVEKLPAEFHVPADLRRLVRYDPGRQELTFQGPMSVEQRDALSAQFPMATVLGPPERRQMIQEIASRGAPLNERQAAALERVLMRPVPDGQTVGERNKLLGLELLAYGPLSQDHRDFLFAAYREQAAWAAQMAKLSAATHVVKYPWSGEYRAEGNPFWWLYEFAFKPLTATMFAMLAFYVASAAFRAFRAKNVEAILLLGTAFIILLGRTFAGVLLTDWFPERLDALKIDNLTIYIMQVFNPAGNRAIMIGIALGIASTSLRVLLGVDRSYLGSGEE